jgi:soluble lytic murein transglycosylase-like protein
MQVGIQRQVEGIRRQVTASTGFFLLPGLMPAPAADVVFSCPPLPGVQVDSLIETSSKREGVPAELVRSVMRQESGFHPCAVSPKGAAGLMQLMPETAAELGVRDPFNPEENVSAGVRFLKLLLNRYDGDVPLALAAFNAGPSRVDKEKAIPPFQETIQYIRDVLTGSGLTEVR